MSRHPVPIAIGIVSGTVLFVISLGQMLKQVQHDALFNPEQI